jgi:Uma2 family endonuclease
MPETSRVLSFSEMLDPADIAPQRIRPLKRVEYHKLIDLGVFEDERVELLAGHLVEMSPQKGPHAAATAELGNRLVRVLHERALVRQQLPIGLSDDSEPEPDIAVVPLGDYWQEHPTTAYLLVEVAQSSSAKDTRLKALLYARANIDEYWIVDVVRHELIVFRQPRVDGYASRQVIGRGDTVAPLKFPDVVLDVGDLVGPDTSR